MGLVLEEALVDLLHRVAQEALRLVLVEDRERLGKPDCLAVHPEGAMADRVEGSAPEASRLDAGQVLDAVKHFLRGLVGEGEEQDLARPHSLGKEVSHAVREGSGLSGARAREDEKRSRLGRHGRELLVIELRTKIDRRYGVVSAFVLEGGIHGIG